MCEMSGLGVDFQALKHERSVGTRDMKSSQFVGHSLGQEGGEFSTIGAPFSVGFHAQLPLPPNGRQLTRRSDGLWFFTYASHTQETRWGGEYTPETDIRIRASLVPNPLAPEDFDIEHVLVRKASGYPTPGKRIKTGGYVIDAEGAAGAGTKPSMVIDPDGVLHLVWMRPDSDEVWYSRCDVSGPEASANLGRTDSWYQADGKTIGAERIAEKGADLGDICLNAEGRPCVVFHNADGVFLSSYENDRWRLVYLTGPGGKAPIVECGKSGILHVVYVHFEGYGGRGLIFYKKSEDGGLSWTGADGRSGEPDLAGGYCDAPPSLAVSGRDILIVHRQAYRVVTFSHHDGQEWRMNQVIPGSYEYTSPSLTVDRHDVIWVQMMSSRHDWTGMSRWLGGEWGDLQQGRHLENPGDACGAERMMRADAEEFGIILADSSHRLYFDTVSVPVPKTEKKSRVMFLDLLEVADIEGVTQVVEPMEKDSCNPVLTHGEPRSWDAMQVNLQGTILKDEDLYRIWYTGFDQKPFFPIQSACGYAESKDGVTWTKPNLGLFPYAGSKENNICFPYGFHYQVLKMPEDLEPDPERRYRMAFTGDSMLLAFSPDGINWTLSEDNPLWRTYSFTRSEYGGSLDNVVYFLDPEEPIAERRFKAYPQTYVARKDNDRVTGLMVSPDGFHFKPYVNNPVIDADLGVEMQHHMMEVCWRRHGVLIGLYGCYLDSVNVDARLAVSRDGVHWVTVKNEVPFLERGEPGAWDAGMVFPSNTPIIEGEDIWIYYSGVEFNFAAGEGHASTGRARVRLDGFAKMQLESEARLGTLTTIPFEAEELKDTRLVVNADGLSPVSSLRVEVLDGTTWEPIGGYTVGDCRPLDQDGIAIPVSWKDETLGGISSESVRFRFLFTGEEDSPRLCSFGFE